MSDLPSQETPPGDGPRLVAVGDLMLADSPTTVGFGFGSRHRNEDPRVWGEALARALPAGDVVFGNLEAVLSPRSTRSGRLRRDQMRSPPRFADALVAAGFTALSVANNHADQHGAQAFHDTVRAVEDRGIRACGLPGSAPWSCDPVVVATGARTVGILAYSLRPRQYGDDDPPPYAVGHSDAMHADIARLREQVDHLVLSLHWGEEFVVRPSRSERELAIELLESGAGVIVGHHPHVVRPVECRDEGVIAYSLGNFAADMLWMPELRRSLVLTVDLGTSGPPRPRLHPRQVGPDGLPRATDRDTPDPSPDTGPPHVLEEAAYDREVRSRLRAQRRALYAYTLRNAWRFPPSVLLDLAATTVRNKVAARVPGGEP